MAPAMEPPPGEAPLADRNLVGEHMLGEFLAQRDAVALHPPSGLGKAPVRSHETRPRDAITVKKDAVVAAARDNAAVANFSEPPPAMLVPHMCHWHVSRPDDRARSVIRAVVSDDNLKMLIVLM